MFGRSWVQFLSGTQIFSLPHVCVKLINSRLIFIFIVQISTAAGAAVFVRSRLAYYGSN